MERRTFLRICGAASIATTAGCREPWRGLSPENGIAVSGRAIFPGTPLRIEVDAKTAPESRIEVIVGHQGDRHIGIRSPVVAGQTLTVETPYPYDDLVPGEYSVTIVLYDRTGSSVESHDVGAYRLVKPWFSA